MTLEEMQYKYSVPDGKLELEELLSAAILTRSLILEELEEIDSEIKDFRKRLENFQ